MEHEKQPAPEAAQGKTEAPTFDAELAALCNKHSVASLFAAVQYTDDGNATVIKFRCDPWRAIGLSELASTVARKVLAKVASGA